MCGGALGEAIGGLDSFANSINPMKGGMEWLNDNTLGKISPELGKLGDWGINHPAESASIYFGGEAMGGALGGLGAAGDAGAGAGYAGEAGLDSSELTAGAGAGAGAGASMGATTASGFGGVGTDAGVAASPDGGLAAGQAGASGGAGNFLQNLFGGGGGAGAKGGIMSALGGSKGSLGIVQLLSSLYGMEQSRKLGKAASAGSINAAGEQSVMRSMASQGYQGSGNMATALQKYGAGAYQANYGVQADAIGGELASMGLLTAGMSNLPGWGAAPAKGG